MGSGAWIRPISDRPTCELKISETRYDNGTIPKLLDIIDVPLAKHAPEGHQTENHIIAPGQHWVNRGELNWADLDAIADDPPTLWANTEQTNAGQFDCVTESEAAQLSNSLLLIKQKHFIVEVATHYFKGTRTYRGKFDYKGTHHSLSLTDPRVRDVFDSKSEGEYPFEDVYLCLSLTAPFEGDGRCHKLVAALITNPAL
jgi:hypothetical protein